MIRFGALSAVAALAVAALSPASGVARAVVVALLVIAASLLVAAREPFPACCAHCPVYTGRRHQAAHGARGESAELRTAHAELEAVQADEDSRHTDTWAGAHIPGQRAPAATEEWDPAPLLGGPYDSEDPRVARHARRAAR